MFFTPPPILGSGPASNDFTTSFPLTEDPISQGSIWLNGLADGLDWNNVKTNGSGAFGSNFVTTFDDDLAHLKTSYRTFANNQVVQGTIFRSAGYFPGTAKHECELLFRFSISAIFFAERVLIA